MNKRNKRKKFLFLLECLRMCPSSTAFSALAAEAFMDWKGLK